MYDVDVDVYLIFYRKHAGYVAQSLTCLATDASLTADWSVSLDMLSVSLYDHICLLEVVLINF